MNVREAILTRRTIRKFENRDVARSLLCGLVELASYAATGANLQPLKFKIADSAELCDRLFPCTKWAGYLEDGTPAPEERPHAYIAVLGDTKIKKQFECDAGAAVTTMMLGAWEQGLATCWLGAIDRDKIARIMDIPQELAVVYLLAVGYPAQESRAVPIQDSVKYWQDADGVINVPKRGLDEILL